MFKNFCGDIFKVARNIKNPDKYLKIMLNFDKCKKQVRYYTIIKCLSNLRRKLIKFNQIGSKIHWNKTSH